MKLSNFEHHLPGSILQRGKSYYKNQYIETLEEISTGQWEAQVEGTDLYTVKITLSGNNITYRDCDCPYDWSDSCKHEVAVLYALREDNVNKYKSQTKKKTLQEKIQIILEKLSEQQLKDYIQTDVLNKKPLRDHFLIHFNHLLEAEANPQQYRQIVNNLIHNHSDHDYIDYRAAFALCDELNDLLDQGKYCKSTNPEQSLTIAVVVLEAMPSIMESIDDSDGGTSIVVASAVEIIIHYLEQQQDQSVIAKLFHWCMQSYLNNVYSGYGDDELKQLFDYFCTKQSPFQTELLQTLDTKIVNSDRYYQSSLLKQKSALLKLWGDSTAARNIILDNMEYTDFRQMIIDEKLAEENHDAAIELIKEGIEIAHKKSHPGTVMSWQKQLLELAKQQKNSKVIVYWAEKLLFDDFSVEYYRLLKHYTDSEDWAAIYKKLHRQLKNSPHNLARLYQEENNHQALFKLVKDDFKHNGHAYTYNSLSLLKAYENILIVDHAEAILKIYAQNIHRHVGTTGKHIYINIAEDLQRMQKIAGGKEQVETIVANFRIQYKNRPLMQKILSQF